MLAPPSGLSAIVFGQLMCLATKLVQETKKDRKVSTYLRLSNKKEHKHKLHKYNPVQLVPK